jgi:hypothetical protein
MYMVKKSFLALLLSFFVLGCMPTTSNAANKSKPIAKETKIQYLAALIIASPIILIYIQDSLPKEITETTLFKKIIGRLEKDPEFKITGFDSETYKGKMTEKQEAYGLVGCFHAKFIKPIKKITDDCKLVRDVLVLVATIMGIRGIVDIITFKQTDNVMLITTPHA